jgi:hypothetical protein
MEVGLFIYMFLYHIILQLLNTFEWKQMYR